MRLRNINGKSYTQDTAEQSDVEQGNEEEASNLERPRGADNGGEGDTWQPSMEGFLKYLVDSKLVFSTIERIVDESEDVSCKLLTSKFPTFLVLNLISSERKLLAKLHVRMIIITCNSTVIEFE